MRPAAGDATAFLRRLDAWRETHHLQGAARAYPHAWRLTELARPLGRAAEARARLALGLNLYELGRLAEAHAALPALHDEAGVDALAAHAGCLCLLGRDAECAGMRAHPRLLAPTPAALAARLRLCFLCDDARAVPSLCRAWRCADADTARDWPDVWRHWAERRLGLRGDEPAAHAALARLRRREPAAATWAAAAHAEAAFHRGAAWSTVWLDEALAQVERFGQHHLKARLWWLKARALQADGQLADAGRLGELARGLARRQGAGLYARWMAEQAHGGIQSA